MTNLIEIGRFCELEVAELVRGGVRLDGMLLDGAARELFLPALQTPTDVEVGHTIEVFIYADHDGNPQATTQKPAATLGDFVCLKCAAVTSSGAFLAWGISKDLYAPPNEQDVRMVEGRSYVVRVCLDRKGERLIASGQLSKQLDYDVESIKPDDEVDLLVYGRVEAGVPVIVNQRYRGLIHQTDIHQSLVVGTKLRGYVRQIRDDNRLDIGLVRRGVGGIHDAQEAILAALAQAGGSLPLHDKSSPDEIKRLLGMSKKAFKRGVGGLYKAKRIAIDEQSITLIDAGLAADASGRSSPADD
ncbi:MAG: S1-like domain-containing RNA-binding protein [Nannocystaceae bacterium]